jgi:hypothetical protein
MNIPNTAIGAVLTGDIVNSTKLLLEQEEVLFKRLRQDVLKTYPHEIYRGDSFQAFIARPGEALSAALACRGLAIQFAETAEMDFDMRLSIGIGKVALPVTDLGMAKGDAFLLSGRQFDTLKEKGRRLIIGCGDRKVDIGFEIMSDYLDSILRKMSSKQAEVIVELLKGTAQQQLSVSLNKSKSTISQLAADGGWSEIERLLHQFNDLIALL